MSQFASPIRRQFVKPTTPKYEMNNTPKKACRITSSSKGMDTTTILLVEAQKGGLRTDVTFTFPYSLDKLKAHKLILALHSPVFDTMFFENEWKSENEVEIVDIDSCVFKVLLEYLYVHEWSTSSPVRTAIGVLYAAKKYLIEDLVTLIREQLKDSITLDTVLLILKSSLLFDFPEVESKCWDCIELDTDRIVLTDEFLSLDKNIIEKILDKSYLTISESKLWDAILRWADAECKRQNSECTVRNRQIVLGDIYKKIRFPIMEPTEFANGPATSGLLSQEEVLNSLMTKFCTTEKIDPLFSPMKRTSKKAFDRLDCKCKPAKIPCSFCRDGEGVTIEPDVLTARNSSSVIIGNRTPLIYCSCRTRNYCPSRKVM